MNLPLLIFDGDCDFCRRWVARWKVLAADRVLFASSDTIAPPEGGRSEQLPETPAALCAQSVVLRLPDGTLLAGAHAVAELLAICEYPRLRACYRHIPGYAAVCERLYRWATRHRETASQITEWLWGTALPPNTYHDVRRLFLRLVAIIYGVALVSLGLQITGLVGSDGILPVGELLSLVQSRAGTAGYWQYPTLCWLAHGDPMLLGLCYGGAGLAAVAYLFPFSGIFFLLLWAIYLSLVTAGQIFLGYQWDVLLLETGFLAMLWAHRDSRLTRFLLRLLLFKLIFSSGLVKLTSHDAAWRSLTALFYHYETQPLTTVAAWALHQLPLWFHELSAYGMFLVELVVPFAFFLPRRPRMLAAWLQIGLQIVLIITGNYGFFNLLTLSLCLLLFDDAAVRTLTTVAVKHRFDEAVLATYRPWPPARLAALAGVCLIVALDLHAILHAAGYSTPRTHPVARLEQALGSFRSVNSYGLFAVMTTVRPEILIEGSMDGVVWKPYRFRWKPDDPSRVPRFVTPHMPRLDWQLWFAALGNYNNTPWVSRLLSQLLHGASAVTNLFAENPFPDNPPRMVRALRYRYTFTNWRTWQKTGHWWHRTPMGSYSPVVSL